jgi:flagellar motor component MotA
MMNNDQFEIELDLVVRKLMSLSMSAKKEGLLALEDQMDNEKEMNRHPLYSGLRMVIDGTYEGIIRQWYDNIMESDCPVPSYERIIHKVIKTGILGIQNGFHERVLFFMMDSCIPLQNRPKIFKLGYEDFNIRNITDFKEGDLDE